MSEQERREKARFEGFAPRQSGCNSHCCCDRCTTARSKRSANEEKDVYGKSGSEGAKK